MISGGESTTELSEEQAMWDEKKRARFQELRRKEEEGTLTAVERTELAQRLRDLEAEEEAYLRPVTEREEAECRQLEAQNAALQALVQREEALVRKLKHFLAEAEAEQRAIEAEKTRILSGSVSSGITS